MCSHSPVMATSPYSEKNSRVGRKTPNKEKNICQNHTCIYINEYKERNRRGDREKDER